MSCLGRVIQTMMLLLLVRLLLLVCVLVAMWLTPPALLTHLLWSLFCLPCVQFLMSSTRASPTMRSPCWRESSKLYTSSARRGGLLGAALSAVTPPTSSPTASRRRSLTPPISTTTTTGMTPATRARVRSTASGIRKRRRSSRR
jgi:hypothetical protein